MKALNIAVLGATGAVGQEMLKILEEYDIPVGELRPLASARSVGKCVKFKGQDVPIQEARDDAFDGLDFESTSTAVIACIGNIGPGLGQVGPVGNFAMFSPISKIVLSLCMLIGRLDIFPILMIFTRKAWSRP